MDTADRIETDEHVSANDETPACEAAAPGDRRTPGERPEMSVAEVWARLRAGQVISHVRVAGRLTIKGEFEFPFRFVDAELANLVIEGATFRAEVSFRNCKLRRPIIQRKTVFAAGLSFQGTDLIKCRFDDVKVHGPANFRNAHFFSKSDVLRTRFLGPVDFWEARFAGWVDFKLCYFDEDADFRSLCADEGFTFRSCTFLKALLFRGASVAKKFEFDKSRFEGLLDLSKAKLHDFVYLEQIEQGPACRLAFWNAVAERIQVRPDQVEGRLASECDGDHARAMSEYGLLKRNFEALHRHEEEDWAFYRFKVNERRSKRRSWRRPWSKLSQAFEWLVLDLGCRYGTSPFRTVGAAGAFILAFAIVYMIGVDSLPMGEGKIPFPGSPTTSLANRVVIGLVTSVSAFTDGLGSLRETAEGWMNLFLVAESLLGTLVWGLFIVAFSRKVIR